MLKRYFRGVIFGLLLLASAHVMAEADTGRVRSLSQKVKCDCGCGDVLAECAHAECKRRPLLKQEIADDVLQGGSDEQILQNLAGAHGAAILVTPMFRGFDMMLWLVPIILGISVLGGVVYKFYKVDRREER